jgi:tetratricopeptide (TPR) repeat protein
MGRLAQRVDVDTLSSDVGALFLLRRAGLLARDALLNEATSHDQEVARQITAELGGLPLALDEAGAYIEETGCSLADYQQLFQRRRAELLKDRRGLVADHPKSVTTTVSLAVQRVEQSNSAAAELLRLCAFLAPDAIPEEIIRQGAEHLGSPLGPVAADAFLLNQAIEVLRASSLIGRDPAAKTLSMHRLVQAVLQDTIAKQEQELLIRRIVTALDAVFPAVPQGVWTQREQCERLLPHTQACAAAITPEIYSLELASLLSKTAYYLHNCALYEQAEPLFLRALHIREQILGSDHLEVGVLSVMLAALYRDQGKYEQAESLYQRALRIEEQISGPEQPSVATILTNMALFYEDQGKYEQAEPLLVRALRIREQMLGSEHPDVASQLTSLGNHYRERGKYEQAEPRYERALRIWKQTLGPEHPDIAYPLLNLADLYHYQGQYERAEPLYEQVESLYEGILLVKEQALGPEHVLLAYPLLNLADLYRRRGKYEQAEPLLVRALRLREQVLGIEHVHVAYPLIGLANLYRDQGKHEQAEPLYQRVLNIIQRQRGFPLPKTAEVLYDFALFFELRNQAKEALTLYQQALAIREQWLGPEHPHTVETRTRYAQLLCESRRLEEEIAPEVISMHRVITSGQQAQANADERPSSADES